MISQSTNENIDVIVIGAGHAGCEAALAAAGTGCSTFVLTPNLDRVGFMPCNPSIGGPGKSHIVAEVDALGGEMARAADRAALQVRRLNISKGPAVQAIRAQEDKTLYALTMKEALEAQPNLALIQDEVIGLIVDTTADGHAVVAGVHTRAFGSIRAGAVVVTAGTFLRAAMISGESRTSGARAGDRADHELAGSLTSFGFKTRRLKTGTPPRIDGRTVDFTLCEEQFGDDEPLWLSRDGRMGRIEPLVLPPATPLALSSDRWRPQLSCWRIGTNEAAHAFIRENLHRAPMFNGSIEGVGPRYCPSIEDKVARFADKPSHPIFLEPEGWRSGELYVQGMSTSLPQDVQDRALRQIPALRDVRVTRYGYAVEYDAVDPAELTTTLETKRVGNLYFAGQINGTSGYEEAAGQGILAGINAANAVLGRPALVLTRDQAYIGVMVDDLVTKPFDEPYRMLTSRAEYRLTLRPSTADRRLGSIAAELGLIGDDRHREIDAESRRLDATITHMQSIQINDSNMQSGELSSRGIDPPGKPMSLAELMRRPAISLDTAFDLAGAIGKSWDHHMTPIELEILEEELKYGVFVEREHREVIRRAALEHRVIPSQIDYADINGLRIEASLKLEAHRPRTIGEASRVSGVTPADIAALLIHAARVEAATS